MTPIDARIRLGQGREEWDRVWRQTCACPLSISERDGRLRCAVCDAPILRRRRVEVQRRGAA